MCTTPSPTSADARSNQQLSSNSTKLYRLSPPTNEHIMHHPKPVHFDLGLSIHTMYTVEQELDWMTMTVIADNRAPSKTTGDKKVVGVMVTKWLKIVVKTYCQ